ncbi:MAG: MoaD/ThiS family protein [Candidatus Hodarchaeota archaeon]
MAIKIKLYGDLREKAPQFSDNSSTPSTSIFEIDDIKTVLDILDKFSIKQEEISHVFVNYKYSELRKEVKDGDRIGIFPKRMGLIFVELKTPF